MSDLGYDLIREGQVPEEFHRGLIRLVRPVNGKHDVVGAERLHTLQTMAGTEKFPLQVIIRFSVKYSAKVFLPVLSVSRRPECDRRPYAAKRGSPSPIWPRMMVSFG